MTSTPASMMSPRHFDSQVLQELSLKLKGGSAITLPVAIKPTNATHSSAKTSADVPSLLDRLSSPQPGDDKWDELMSDPDSDSAYSDTETDSGSDGGVDSESDECDPWTQAMLLNGTHSATPPNSPLLPINTSPASLDNMNAELLSSELSRLTEKHIICWTCGVTTSHDVGCRRKHIPSKVRVPLQPAREMRFPKPLPTIRECEVDFPVSETSGSSDPLAISAVAYSASMEMLKRIAADDARARTQVSGTINATRMISERVEGALRVQIHIWRGLPSADAVLGKFKIRPSLFNVFPDITFVDAVAAQY